MGKKSQDAFEKEKIILHRKSRPEARMKANLEIFNSSRRKEGKKQINKWTVKGIDINI